MIRANELPLIGQTFFVFFNESGMTDGFVRSFSVVTERVVSGDIKVKRIRPPENNLNKEIWLEVDQSDDWLFDWERADTCCYARCKQSQGIFKYSL